jgi:signal peptidase II
MPSRRFGTGAFARGWIGLVVAALVLLFDQLSKFWALEALQQPPRMIEVTSFFNLVLVWNWGISFGILNRESSLAPWLFVALAGAVSIALILWLRRVSRSFLALAVGLVLGGALGNLIDRLRFRAVVDFLDFHAGSYHWPTFNIADSAITVGILCLAVHSLLIPRKRLR